MKSYLDIVKNVLDNGEKKPNRTGVATKSVIGTMFRHNMQEGFPLLTTKRIAFKSVRVELEAFIHGITSKKWLQDRGCTIWNEWSAPGGDDDNLGPIYGAQWRNFGGVDQLKNVIGNAVGHPYSRRLIVSAWNPADIDKMALPPCHMMFQLTYVNHKLNLTWYQRSCDVMLGLPFNIASYALLLHLIATYLACDAGELIGMLNDTHIYNNHIAGAKLQLERTPTKLPTIETDWFSSVFDWDHTMTRAIDYNPQEKIKFDVAV